MNEAQLIRIGRVWGYLISIEHHHDGSVTVFTTHVSVHYTQPLTRAYPNIQAAITSVIDKLISYATRMVTSVEEEDEEDDEEY